MKVVWNRAQKAVIFCFHGWGEDMERQAGRRRKREGFYGRIKTTHYFNERSNFCRIVNSVLDRFSKSLSFLSVESGGLRGEEIASPLAR